MSKEAVSFTREGAAKIKALVERMQRKPNDLTADIRSKVFAGFPWHLMDLGFRIDNGTGTIHINAGEIAIPDYNIEIEAADVTIPGGPTAGTYGPYYVVVTHVLFSGYGQIITTAMSTKPVIQLNTYRKWIYEVYKEVKDEQNDIRISRCGLFNISLMPTFASSGL